MKNYLQKLDKNALKLSLICSLNWLVSFVGKGQFYLFSAIFLGISTHYMPLDLQRTMINVLEVLVVIKCVTVLYQVVVLNEFRPLKSLFHSVVLFLFFIVGNKSIYENSLKQLMISHILEFWLLSFIVAILVTVIQPRLFKHYLFKYVIDKNYLGIRTISDPLPPENNLYTDAEEANVDKRMTIINQRAVKSPYQDCVELTYLNQEILTGLGYEKRPYGEESVRNFIIADTLYYPVFTVHLFGKEEDFYHRLIDFKLSRKAAFTAIGVRKLNQGE
ncbi:hypothetical protein [Streptococcus suis]